MAEYDFMEAYTGPHGPHLSFLTRYTMTRKEEHRLQGRSIRGHGDNTMVRSNGTRQRRAAAAIDAHLVRHPRDKQSETHRDALLARAAKA